MSSNIKLQLHEEVRKISDKLNLSSRIYMIAYIEPSISNTVYIIAYINPSVCVNFFTGFKHYKDP